MAQHWLLHVLSGVCHDPDFVKSCVEELVSCDQEGTPAIPVEQMYEIMKQRVDQVTSEMQHDVDTAYHLFTQVRENAWRDRT